MLLADYASDSSTDEQLIEGSTRLQPQKVTLAQIDGPTNNKKRNLLPSLPGDFVPGPNDDPSLHQGRKRTRPFVEGEYSAHIYLKVAPPKALRRTIADLIKHIQALLSPEFKLNSLLSAPPKGQPATAAPIDHDLHVSLTHPLPLVRTRINELRGEVENRLKATQSAKPFRLSFVGDVKCYYNGRRYGGEGEGGRAFMALRVGSGAPEILKIAQDALDPLLQSLHLPTYHKNPEFHASFAWTLLPEEDEHKAKSYKSTPVNQERSSDTASIQAKGDNASSTKIPPLSPFSPEVLDQLNRKFRENILKAQPEGGWIITGVTVKIGNSTSFVPFRETTSV
ncbi:hypothetical protein BCR39DRAFT_538049 [Naematelia encephala]|uniref:U6 snRNA phosphodiesterase 1 n=1 Tax=Naematelia encephala TaxID=71784 RepID=A0A1Y2AYB1_9TREE|nr:hypothetical protein BCR39DRAFT_538049 [Naematelia encephala]